MIVDILIKSLPRNKHFQCIENLGMCLIIEEKPTSQHQALMTFHAEPYYGSDQDGGPHTGMNLVFCNQENND
jgi:hypothetical protein